MRSVALERVLDLLRGADAHALTGIDVVAGLGGELLPCGCNLRARSGGIDRLVALMELTRDRIKPQRSLRVAMSGTFGTSPGDPGSLEGRHWAARVEAIAGALCDGAELVIVPSARELRDIPLLDQLVARGATVLCSNVGDFGGSAVSRRLLVHVGATELQLEAIVLALGFDAKRDAPAPTEGGTALRVVLLDAHDSTPEQSVAAMDALSDVALVVACLPPALSEGRLPVASNRVLVGGRGRGRTLDSMVIAARPCDRTLTKAQELLAISLASLLVDSRYGGTGEAARIASMSAELEQCVRNRAKAGSLWMAVREEVIQSLPRSKIAVSRLNTYFERLQAISGEFTIPRRTDGYAGSDACATCHRQHYLAWRGDGFHSAAHLALASTGRGTDSQCFPCHATGYKEGWTSVSTGLDELAVQRDVGCESCHGPGGSHVERPNVALDAGGSRCPRCHDLEHSPEFRQSPGSYLSRIGCVRLVIGVGGTAEWERRTEK